MDYKEALEFINKINTYGMVLGLETINELLKRIGNPQEKLSFVHIAGTNGKGSTAAFISFILAEAGYQVGRYISPTLFCYRERIQTLKKESDHKRAKEYFISELSVASHLTRIKKAVEAMVLDGFVHPTAFEIETAMAFLEFAERRCDIVVLEVGLGGRLDATNIISSPKCVVLTSISMDHMQVLGDTLKKIAEEKAGIIKENSDVVCYPQKKEARQVIERRCKEKKASLKIVDFNQINSEQHSLDKIQFSYTCFTNLELSLLGENQVKNAVIAIETMKILQKKGFYITNNHIQEGLKKTVWRGRFDVLLKSPFLIVDGAHNQAAAISLRRSIGLYLKGKRLIFIIGVFKDKDYLSIIKNTADLADMIFTITPNHPRALSSTVLKKEVKSYNHQVIDLNTIEEALQEAFKIAQKEDVILAFGSLSFLGDIFRFLNYNG